MPWSPARTVRATPRRGPRRWSGAGTWRQAVRDSALKMLGKYDISRVLAWFWHGLAPVLAGF